MISQVSPEFWLKSGKYYLAFRIKGRGRVSSWHDIDVRTCIFVHWSNYGKYRTKVTLLEVWDPSGIFKTWGLEDI